MTRRLDCWRQYYAENRGGVAEQAESQEADSPDD